MASAGRRRPRGSGLEATTRKGPRKRLPLLQLVLCNGTTAQGIQRYTEQLQQEKRLPHLLFVQEHHCRGEQLTDHQAWLAKAGYHSHVSPALPGAGKGTKAGVAVLARANLPLTKLHAVASPAAVAGHLAVGHVSTFCKGGVACLSIYLAVGIGIAFENAEILAKAARVVKALQSQWILAGDFNNPIEALEPYAKAIGGHIIAPSMSTCLSASGGSVIDYAIVSPGLFSALTSITVDEQACTAPHRPVLLTFSVPQEVPMVRQLRCPAPLPRGLPLGCARAPP